MASFRTILMIDAILIGDHPYLPDPDKQSCMQHLSSRCTFSVNDGCTGILDSPSLILSSQDRFRCQPSEPNPRYHIVMVWSSTYAIDQLRQQLKDHSHWILGT